MLLLAAPKNFTQLLAGIPTSSRTIGNSLSYCFFSYFQELIKSLIVGDEQRQFFISIIVCQGVIAIIGVVMIIIVITRVGNTSSEIGKIGFREKQIRELKVDEGKVRMLRVKYELKKSKKTQRIEVDDLVEKSNVESTNATPFSKQDV